MMLSCSQVSPSASLPSAARQASLALVPVPHGERAARLVDDRGAVRVEFFAKTLDALLERAGAEVGAALQDKSGGLAAGVRIKDVDRFHG